MRIQELLVAEAKSSKLSELTPDVKKILETEFKPWKSKFMDRIMDAQQRSNYDDVKVEREATRCMNDMLKGMDEKNKEIVNQFSKEAIWEWFEDHLNAESKK